MPMDSYLSLDSFNTQKSLFFLCQNDQVEIDVDRIVGVDVGAEAIAEVEDVVVEEEVMVAIVTWSLPVMVSFMNLASTTPSATTITKTTFQCLLSLVQWTIPMTMVL